MKKVCLYFLLIPALLFVYQQLFAGYRICPSYVQGVQQSVTEAFASEDCHFLKAFLRLASENVSLLFHL